MVFTYRISHGIVLQNTAKGEVCMKPVLKQLKGFVCGVLVTVLLLSCITVFASATTRQISILSGHIRLVVDGQYVVPADAQGRVVEPFVYDGTTFVPVRAIAEALGLDVTWNGNTSTVYLTRRAQTTTTTPTVTTPPPTPTQPQGNETVSQRNAVRAAENYIQFMAFSRSGLIAQLEFEGFSNIDAVHGVDNITVNWYEQAARMAQSYLDLMPFSRNGLIDQLIFSGFTREQAIYGVNAVGL